MDNDVQRFEQAVADSTIATSTTSEIPAHSHYNRRFAELENSIRKINENIEQLKGSVSLSDEDKERFSMLEERAINLENLVDNHNRAVNEETNKFESVIGNLTNSVSSLNMQLSALQQKAAEQERSQTQKRLATECIEDIQSHNFKAAEAKLNLLDDENKINLIVHQVYNYQAANFYLILEFGDYIRCVRTRFLVYKALNYEMESNAHGNISKMIKLCESLKKEIINKTEGTSDTKLGAENCVRKIRNLIESIGKEKLKEGMSHDGKSVVDLAKIIYDFDHKMFKELFAKAVNEVYVKTSIEKLISSIPNDPMHIEQAAQAYFILLDELQRRGDFSTNAIFKVAYAIKSSIKSGNSNFPRLKNRFPESVRNAVFASIVCIKNVSRNEYLYAARMPGGRTYDEHRGYVFTWIPGDRVRQGDWIIECDGDDFYIKNYMHNIYLYSSRPNDEKRNKDRGYVFTWIPGNRVPDAKWTIEPDGDNCHIKNVMRNEYLYSARWGGETYDSERGYVYTWIPGNRVIQSEWKIEDGT